MKGYKATYNFKCKNLTFEIGKTYTHEGELIPCEQGLHFCKNPDHLFVYYPYQSNLRLLEIEVLGDVIDEGDKSVTNKLKVIREIPFVEWNNIFTKHKFTKKGNELEIKREYSDGSWEKSSYDNNGNKIKIEYSDGNWWKSSYDKHSNLIKTEYSNGYWEKYSYDKHSNLIKTETSNGIWYKYIYDDNSNLIYF